MSENRHKKLTDGYCGFFKTLPYVAVSPYLGAFGAGCLFSPFNKGESKGLGGALAGGIALCIIFTAIPILPAVTLITTALALAAFVIAGLSALVTYPATAIANCMDEGIEEDITLFSLK